MNTIARQRCVAVAILMTLALTGCWPARFTEEPGFAPQRREWSWQMTGAKTQNVGVVALTPVR